VIGACTEQANTCVRMARAVRPDEITAAARAWRVAPSVRDPSHFMRWVLSARFGARVPMQKIRRLCAKLPLARREFKRRLPRELPRDGRRRALVAEEVADKA